MALTGEQAYALARKYVATSIAGAGAIAGKNCEIQSITSITGGNRITFAWYDGDDVLQTSTLDVMDGDDGTSATISVGTVTSGATASVTNSGTSSAAVFDFVLPKGDAGTTDYTNLQNQPQINGHTLTGNKSSSDLGIVTIEFEDDTMVIG